jgi:hypothetical protein
MDETRQSVLSLKEFPSDLLKSLKTAALHNDMTLRDFVISSLRQIVDNGDKQAPNKRKS